MRILHAFLLAVTFGFTVFAQTGDPGESLVRSRGNFDSENPAGKVYLTYSSQYVRLYKVDTGELIETIVHPPFTVVKQKHSIKEYVKEAGWADGSKTLFVVNAEGTMISLWDFKG